jgi:5,10-methylenetetrahydromethanopterin reductase
VTNLNVKFGYDIPLFFVPVQRGGTVLEKMYSTAKEAEKNGFDSVWFSDHIIMPPFTFMPDAWTLMTAVAMQTERVSFGTRVSPPHGRHPAIFANMLATIDQISRGRVILGLGAGESMHLDPFGIEWNQPVTRMKETIEVMRRLWTEKKVTFQGKFFNLKDAFLQVKPVHKSIPIYIGSNGPLTRRLTGEIGDGWMPWVESPKTYEKHLKEVEEGARKAGRSMDEIDTVYHAFTAIAQDPEQALKRLSMFKSFFVYFQEKLIYEFPNVKIPLTMKVEKVTLNDLERISEAAEMVPDEALARFNIAGTVDDAMNQIERYLKAGARHITISNMGPNQEEVFRAFTQKIIPYFKETYS